MQTPTPTPRLVIHFIGQVGDKAIPASWIVESSDPIAVTNMLLKAVEFAIGGMVTVESKLRD